MLDLLQNEEIKYNFVLHTVDQSSDWQWLIDYIEKEYQYDDYDDWNNYWRIFKDPLPEPIKIFRMIMSNVNEKKLCLNFKREDIGQMWDIAKFFNNEITWEDAIKKVNINSLKVILLALYITNLLNKANKTRFDIYWEILVNTNLFQIYDLSLIKEHKIEIIDFLNTINLKNIDKLKDVLSSNINKIEINYNNNLLHTVKEKELSIDSFSFKALPPSNKLSWQENTIINMLDYKFKKSNFIPEVRFLKNYPYIGNWNKNIVISLKKYFGKNNKIANFVIETAYYLRNRKDDLIKQNRQHIPSDEIINLHLKLVAHAIRNKENDRTLLTTSSIYLLSCLFRDKATKTLKNYSEYKYIIQWVKTRTNIFIERQLQELGFPISPENQLWIEESDKRNLTDVSTITTVIDFCKFLNQKKLVNTLTETQLKKIKSKFWNLLNEDETDTMYLSDLFIDYSKFLSKCFDNKNLNKSLLNIEIIRIQLFWENNVYPRSTKQMIEEKIETTVSDEVINDLKEASITNPLTVVNQLLPLDEYNMFKQLNMNSETPMLSLFTRIKVEDIFPQKITNIDLNRHKIEKYFIEYINGIKRKYQGLFLNNMETEKDLQRIFSYYEMDLSYLFLLDKKQMYNKIIDSCKYSLDPYTEKTTLGLVTQLFPILEMKIRQVASYCGISPFKNNSFNDVGVKYNDPSTLLIKIISTIYKGKGNLLSAQGFIFVYLTMYDSNFKNIRNNLIHARNFLKNADLDLALRCTLLSISVIDYYLNKVLQNNDQSEISH